MSSDCVLVRLELQNHIDRCKEMLKDSKYGNGANEPSTPRSTDHNVQDNVVDAESVPQAGSYQPTPPGSKFWIPEAKKKPVEGTEFDTIEQAFTFYKEYAREGGFEVRRGGQSNRKKKQNPDLKYFCCSKEGVKQPKKDKRKPDTSSSDIAEVVKVIKRRKRASQRCGCKALLRLRKTPCGNKYVVYTFFEKHNHSLVHENDYKYLRAARKLTFSKQQLLRQLSEANIGPTRAWKVVGDRLKYPFFSRVRWPQKQWSIMITLLLESSLFGAGVIETG
ncbi:FAR1 DNA binding domain, Zinc finger, SWIM-type, MULE transposase domain, FHY3/FAR1 family [Artemisia annua]|uniref:FAR1 DNA binding domain, Zinc finger, SWIM-type, MULE transposase domain, FHY3/FAR1 family n=1 Tax=Artemisia annua TaxID=35608 RepID=A0A2U1QK85_ARTAN|nr:FAR1 DNA binding domain, Zinc finger, SWIM-type, MULE transposase domain, FHY3/FAR1 family [Artemisia annua]